MFCFCAPLPQHTCLPSAARRQHLRLKAKPVACAMPSHSPSIGIMDALGCKGREREQQPLRNMTSRQVLRLWPQVQAHTFANNVDHVAKFNTAFSAEQYEGPDRSNSVRLPWLPARRLTTLQHKRDCIHGRNRKPSLRSTFTLCIPSRLSNILTCSIIVFALTPTTWTDDACMSNHTYNTTHNYELIGSRVQYDGYNEFGLNWSTHAKRNRNMHRRCSKEVFH
jgi:hypothetical protein